MFGTNRSDSHTGATAPSHFRDRARNAIYQELPVAISAGGNTATSIRSAPTHLQPYKKLFPNSSHRSSASSVFSSGKRSVRSAPSMYSNSTATIPEDSEPITTTVEQLINDIMLHETVSRDSSMQPEEDETWKISLGSQLQYQNVPESLVDWNLNVTRCKLFLRHLPTISSVPDFKYTGAVPQLVGDLAYICHIVLISATISDKELIYILLSSNLYQEHNLDSKFKKSVAEISVKQSRLLQINSQHNKKSLPPITSIDNQTYLRLEFKEIAVRNYLINLAAAATTAHEYKLKSDEMKRNIKASGDKKAKLPKDEKKRLWEYVRSDVFKRAGLEE
ncbi:hypothetical protein CAAN1_14S00342 [[Candida] anglica]|uniref:Transcription factor n=1 Tax=[Candida] anglica TaxID=148631 RepID=A0ABP0EIX4_9ASCO